jgi:ubiquinone/menaquinone biosynthesis C-methylase UbiE
VTLTGDDNTYAVGGKRSEATGSRESTTVAYETPSGTYRTGYFATRLAANAKRAPVWRHICAYLERWISTDADVLELGAGWCDFSNLVRARSVTAVDLESVVLTAAADHVRAVVGDCTDLVGFADASFDVVFASNLLEHLERPQSDRLLAEASRVLRPGGRLILLQPNFRLQPGRYFDDFTHVAIFTDQSLSDYLAAGGWQIEHVAARFLPLSMRSRGSSLSFLVPAYLRSPVKPLAGQMLVVARRPPDVSA